MANLLHIVFFTNTTWYVFVFISLWVTFQLQFNQRTKIQLESEGTFYCELIVYFDRTAEFRLMLLCCKEGPWVGGWGVGESLSREVRGSSKKYVEVASPFARTLSAVVDPLVAL